jgi:hypothetical protein
MTLKRTGILTQKDRHLHRLNRKRALKGQASFGCRAAAEDRHLWRLETQKGQAYLAGKAQKGQAYLACLFGLLLVFDIKTSFFVCFDA